MIRKLLHKTVLAGVALATGIGLAAGTAQAAADGPLKVGFVYVSPIGDAGWTYQHDLGRKALETAFGDKVETSFVESVPEGADAERVIQRFAQSGYDLIFTTSFGYMNPTIKVAKRFPKVKFEHVSGYKRAANVSTSFARLYEARYLTGIVAGKMTKSNVVGYVAAFPIPEVVRGINAFTRGLRSVNPQARVKVIWVNSWYDPGKEREASETLIAQGADVLTQHTDSTAVVQAANDRGVYAIGYHSDMSKFGPKAQLTAATHRWETYYTQQVKAVMEGTWKSGDTWGGIKDGMVELAPFNPVVPGDVAALVKQTQDDIIAGKLHPFAGPVVAQDGKTVVPAGQVMSDGDLLSMNYYVEGVEGKLPQ